MCIEFHLRGHPGEDAARFEAAGASVFWADAPPPRPADHPIRPTDQAFLIRAMDAGGLEGVVRRWWLVPAFHKGPVGAWRTLCANAPLDALDSSPIFRDAYRSRRALIPLTSFIAYEEPPGWRKASAAPAGRGRRAWAGRSSSAGR